MGAEGLNQKRQKEKYDEIRFTGYCWVLHEEADVFRTKLQVNGISFKETEKTDYFTKFERGAFQ
jgi:hypothetical protein